jgi:transposase
MRTAYQTDLSDAEWSCLEPHLPTPKAIGRPRMHTTREILNAIFYVVRGGCAWRLLPNDLERFAKWLAHFANRAINSQRSAIGLIAEG